MYPSRLSYVPLLQKYKPDFSKTMILKPGCTLVTSVNSVSTNSGSKQEQDEHMKAELRPSLFKRAL